MLTGGRLAPQPCASPLVKANTINDTAAKAPAIPNHTEARSANERLGFSGGASFNEARAGA